MKTLRTKSERLMSRCVGAVIGPLQVILPCPLCVWESGTVHCFLSFRSGFRFRFDALLKDVSELDQKIERQGEYCGVFVFAKMKLSKKTVSSLAMRPFCMFALIEFKARHGVSVHLA